VPQIHRLELDRAAGRPVNEASLYRGFVEEWMLRDEGKHVFTKEHKQLMMERLAADLWRDHAREWPWSKVADWLDTFLYENPKVAARYARANIPADILNADFRTATFFLRPDAAKDGFRFAHTSLQEYFLACHLVRSLEGAASVQAWDLPMTSTETLDFLGQLLALQSAPEKNRSLRVLGDIMGQDCLQAAWLAFRYWMQAIEHDLPEPSPQKVNLPGAVADGGRICGRGPGQRLNLRGANLRGIQLNHALLNCCGL